MLFKCKVFSSHPPKASYNKMEEIETSSGSSMEWTLELSRVLVLPLPLTALYDIGQGS